MKVIVKHWYCDICHFDGEDNVEAVASYLDNDGFEHDICQEHLETVKKAKLKYVLYGGKTK